MIPTIKGKQKLKNQVLTKGRRYFNLNVFFQKDAVKLPLLLREGKPTYRKHDQLYKELIHTFFREFLEGFFPQVYDSIDFQSVHTMSEEIHTVLLKGESRRLDIVKGATFKKTNTKVIIHIEPQSYVEKRFNERMYQYFSMLYNKYMNPVIPIAVFRYAENWDESRFIIKLPFLHSLTFNYFTLHLKKIKNWRDYLHTDNPAVAALLSEMGYKKEERVEVKKEFLRMTARLKLDPARDRLVRGFFESYLTLTKEEEEELMKEIEKLPEREQIMELPISYEERGKEIGRDIERREVALKMLKKNLDEELIKEITNLNAKEIEELKKKF